MKNIVIIFVFSIFSHLLNGQEISFDTIKIINNNRFEIRTHTLENSENSFLKVSKNSKVILSDEVDLVGLREIEFLDFNQDTYIDIKLSYFGNNESSILYLFDLLDSKLKKLEGFERFGSSEPLKDNSNYYYSYNRAGCADSNWESRLYKIVENKTVMLGYIYGQGCEFDIESNPQLIAIYTINDNNQDHSKILQTYPYRKFIKKFEQKWDFIEEYWNSNYKKFD